MPKPITPLCGCDVFITNQLGQVLLIQRSDNQLWALPGGCQELNETPANCAIRECLEETGYHVKLNQLLGVWSSLSYPYINYPWKDNIFTHLMFSAEIIGGAAKSSDETTQIAWFVQDNLPQLSDGHEIRIKFGFKHLNINCDAYFE